jgi:hypothetical protein
MDPSGPFVKSGYQKRSELSKALFGMVKKYITDSNIQLTLDNDNNSAWQGDFIRVRVSW